MRLVILAFLVPLFSPASAQDLTASEAATLPRILDTLCLDLIPDRIGCETAVLLTSQTDDLAADLVIFSDRREGVRRNSDIIAVARNLVFNGWAFGQSPLLEDANGSLRVLAEQTGVGRTPWTETLTLAWRNGAVQVAGLTYTARDRLNTAYMTCDVNLLTGRWETLSGVGALDTPAEESQGRAAPMAAPVETWSVETPRPAVCDAVEARFADLSEMDIPE
jgi:hypothetical protein